VLRYTYIADIVEDSNVLRCKAALTRNDRPTSHSPTQTLNWPWADPEDGSSTILRNVGNYYKSTGCHNPEDLNVDQYRCENLQSQMHVFVCGITVTILFTLNPATSKHKKMPDFQSKPPPVPLTPLHEGELQNKQGSLYSSTSTVLSTNAVVVLPDINTYDNASKQRN
jgi:hypothetical protein